MWYISICGKWWWREQTSFPCCTCEICSLFLRWCIQGGQHLKSFLCQCHLFLLDYDAQSQQTNDIGSIFVVTLGYSLSLFWLSEDAYQHHWKNGWCNKIDLHFISFFPQFLSILESIFMWQLAFQININKCWIHISHTPLKTNISPKNLMLRFHESSCWNGLFSSQVDPQPFAACMAGWVSSRSLWRRIHWKRSGGASFCQKTVEKWKVLSLSTSFFWIEDNSIITHFLLQIWGNLRYLGFGYLKLMANQQLFKKGTFSHLLVFFVGAGSGALHWPICSQSKSHRHQILRPCIFRDAVVSMSI